MGVVAVVKEDDGDFVLLASRDGRIWSRESLTELVGEPLTSAPGVTMTTSTAVVTVVPDRGDRDPDATPPDRHRRPPELTRLARLGPR